MAPAEKARTNNRFEPYDAQASHHKAKIPDDADDTVAPSKTAPAGAPSDTAPVHAPARAADGGASEPAATTAPDAGAQAADRDSVSHTAPPPSHEPESDDASDSDSDSDIVEIEGPLKTSARSTVVAHGSAAVTAAREVIEIDEIEGDEEDALADDDDDEVQEVRNEEDEDDIDEDEDEDDDEEDEQELDLEVDNGIHLTVMEQVDLIDQMMANYNPETDPEFQELLSKEEDEGYLDELLAAGGVVDDDVNW